LDGTDIRDLNVAWLRSQIGLVSQEPALFNEDIFENIAIGKEGCTRTEVETAAKKAYAHEFISNLPLVSPELTALNLRTFSSVLLHKYSFIFQGYKTRCGERGSQLSGLLATTQLLAQTSLNSTEVLMWNCLIL
jgi:ABC-type multidrug transport system fused ATPase/permease subunit